MAAGRYFMLLSAVFILCCWSIESKQILSEDKLDSSDGCKINGKFYKTGSQWTVLGECNIYTCHKGGSYSALTCPLVRLPNDSKCHFTGIDLNKNYPKCCPQVVCPEG